MYIHNIPIYFPSYILSIISAIYIRSRPEHNLHIPVVQCTRPSQKIKSPSGEFFFVFLITSLGVNFFPGNDFVLIIYSFTLFYSQDELYICILKNIIAIII